MYAALTTRHSSSLDSQLSRSTNVWEVLLTRCIIRLEMLVIERGMISSRLGRLGRCWWVFSVSLFVFWLETDSASSSLRHCSMQQGMTYQVMPEVCPSRFAKYQEEDVNSRVLGFTYKRVLCYWTKDVFTLVAHMNMLVDIRHFDQN